MASSSGPPEEFLLCLEERYREPTGEKHWFYIIDSDDEWDPEEDERRLPKIRKKLLKVKKNSNNGYFFNEKHFLPEEVLSLILSYVEPQDLVFNCRRVCKAWCNVIDSQVWDLQLKRNNFVVTKPHYLKWVYYYWILSKKDLFNRNLVKNGCGEDNLPVTDFKLLDGYWLEDIEHWENVEDFWEHISWGIENPPSGCQDFPQDIDKEVLKHNSCFATRDWYKTQFIDLKSLGITRQFMNIVKPKIVYSDWICGRFDISSIIQVDVMLVNEHYKKRYHEPRLVDPEYDVFDHAEGIKALFQYCKKIGGEYGSTWHKITHTFETTVGAESIVIEHAGKDYDPNIEERLYGCKVTGTKIVLSI